MRTFLQVAQVVISIVLIIVVLRQPGKADGFNLISSGADTFYSKNKTKTYEGFLAKLTVVLAILFAIITIGLNLVK